VEGNVSAIADDNGKFSHNFTGLERWSLFATVLQLLALGLTRALVKIAIVYM
jgi:hypothetical protein